MSELHLNYIGSKKKLFNRLDKVFKLYVNEDSIFGDYFAGTGIVSYLIAQKYNCTVVSNDLQYYSYVINYANLSKYTLNEQKQINEYISIMNNLEPVRGFMTINYAPPKRKYFTRNNASKIDGMRLWLEKNKHKFKFKIYMYLLAKIIVSSDKVANTSSVYASYLKEFKTTALKPIILLPYPSEKPIWDKKHYIYNMDVEKLISKINIKPTIVYLDPPYNTRQYSDNYHILDTIALYDSPDIHGITGIRDILQKSDFAKQSNAENAMNNLIFKLKDIPILIMSYNDEGILTHSQIIDILKQHGKVKMYKLKYNKFKGQDNVSRDTVFEYIFVSIK